MLLDEVELMVADSGSSGSSFSRVPVEFLIEPVDTYTRRCQMKRGLSMERKTNLESEV